MRFNSISIRHSRFFISLSIGIISGVIVLFLYSQRIDFLDSLDLKLKDTRFKLRDDIKPDKRVTIVAIDSKSINEFGRWPWDRKIIARLINNLKSYGAKTIAFDIVFSELSNPISDKAISGVIKSSGNVIAGYFFRHEKVTQSMESSESLQSSKIKVMRMQGNVNEAALPTYPNVETNITLISKASVSSGFFNIIPDEDGIIRRANLLILFNGNIYPSLSLAALRHYLGSEIILDISSYFGVDRLIVENRRIPVDETGRLTLNYYGREGTFKTVPAVDVIKKKLDDNFLKDALVFIGPTEIGIGEMKATPLDPVLPGVEIHATVASNVLQERYIIRDSKVIGLEIFFIIAFPMVLSIILSLIRKTVTALSCFIITLGLYFTLDYLIFKHYSLNTTLVFPAISITLSYLASEAYRNLVGERYSRFLKKAFSSYVSPDLVGEMIKNPDLLKLGGVKREITVLFSDIRDFTGISERLIPEDLVLLLNRYLDPMTHIVLKYKGTLDKYIGDAIMAVYNAPLSIENHPFLACKTALEMIEKLKEINSIFREEGLPEIAIGVGINTGDAVVGNMGTDVRFDYTAIGDTVNLASRLADLNKNYKTHIIVSESTVTRIRESGLLDSGEIVLHFRELDLIKVRGKDKPVTIYELSS